MDGADGAKAVDDFWPAFHQSDVHASPLMVDFDYDGVLDILLATSDGELLVVKDTVRSCLLQMQHSRRRTVGQCSGPAALQHGQRLTLSVPLGRQITSTTDSLIAG